MLLESSKSIPSPGDFARALNPTSQVHALKSIDSPLFNLVSLCSNQAPSTQIQSQHSDSWLDLQFLWDMVPFLLPQAPLWMMYVTQDTDLV